MINEPGIAMRWYFVQMFVISAAFPRTTSSMAVYVLMPHTQWPAILPSDMVPSSLKINVLKMYARIEW